MRQGRRLGAGATHQISEAISADAGCHEENPGCRLQFAAHKAQQVQAGEELQEQLTKLQEDTDGLEVDISRAAWGFWFNIECPQSPLEWNAHRSSAWLPVDMLDAPLSL